MSKQVFVTFVAEFVVHNDAPDDQARKAALQAIEKVVNYSNKNDLFTRFAVHEVSDDFDMSQKDANGCFTFVPWKQEMIEDLDQVETVSEKGLARIPNSIHAMFHPTGE